jgi:hypothetical protein
MRTVELVSEWDSVPFSGGYGGLQSLSDQGFSGVVTTGPTQLFMLNGTAVGVLDGDIEAFDGTDGTARAAPHDALPLLVVMQDRAEGPRAQYYTEDTPISEVDRTLKDGNFTGFVELSENVLSGDYYMVYHQGRSMSVAWVGNSQKLITDEEAFEQADGEVGIYQVMPADIEPVEIPEPSEPSPSADAAAGTAATSTDDGTEHSDDPAGGETGTPTPDGAADDETADQTTEVDSRSSDERAAAGSDHAEASDAAGAGTVSATDAAEPKSGAGGPPGSKAAGASQGTAVDQQRREAAGATERGTATDERERETTAAESAAPTTDEPEPTEPAIDEAESAEPATDDPETAEPATRDAGVAESATETTEPAGPSLDRTAQTEATQTNRSEAPATTEGGEDTTVGDLETRSIPSLDPERSSSTPEATTTTAVASSTSKPSQSNASQSSQSTSNQQSQSNASQSTSSQKSQRQQSSATGQTQAEGGSTASGEPQSAPSPELEAELEKRDAEIAELEGEIRDLSTENEELAAERDRLLGELEDARAEIQRLEEELAAAGGPTPSGETLSPAAAIDGTNLFVRYHSKGEATLEKAQNGSADRAAVEENLRLEHHTQFDAADAVVDGEAFEAFLQDSIQYRFVDWLVRNLLYEIRDTGHESAMGVLYDALPKVDRAELNGKVSVTYTEDGQEHRSQETFDVVVRDRMGNPLVVANINDSRQPATEGQMTDIVRNAERVGNASDSLAAAFLVTSSFFEPEALETAKEATSSGLFSRDKRKSFVNLSRKGGYHLCLLEARNKEFHLAVPEL